VTEQFNSSHGILLVEKQPGVSSYDCIRQIKRAIGPKQKIGHAGTLDPFASGLLIIGIGRPYTKQLGHAMAYPKEYVAQGKLNVLTDTLDPTGQIIKTCDKETITEKQVRAALESFGSSYEQVPPIYSALKYQGHSLYRVARKGKMSSEELQKIINAKKRTVHIYSLTLLNFQFPYFTIKAHVSRGTYIRCLVNDIAVRCNSFATTNALERSAIGPFTLDSSAKCDYIAAHWLSQNSWDGAPFYRQELP